MCTTLDIVASDNGLPTSALRIEQINPNTQFIVLAQPRNKADLANFGVVGSHFWQEAEARAITYNLLT